ncbi:E3 ubiquitin-protein ligase RNF139 isoform X5 [Halichoerus grypus]
MAAVGPPQQQVRMAHQQVWAALEVALRVPCLYIIDAIFNSYYDSSQSRFCIGLQIFLRLLAEIGGSLSEENEATQKDPDKLTFRNPW